MGNDGRKFWFGGGGVNGWVWWRSYLIDEWFCIWFVCCGVYVEWSGWNWNWRVVGDWYFFC